MSVFAEVEGRSVLLLQSSKGITSFEVDGWAVPFLKEIGNFHPVYASRPDEFVPVIRRRHPTRGHPVSLRLTQIVAILHACGSDERRWVVARDLDLLLQASKEIRISRYPMDDNVRNCKFSNWTRPAVHVVRRSLLSEDTSVIPQPEISPERVQEILQSLSPSAEDVKSPFLGQNPERTEPVSSPKVDDVINRRHASASVDDILRLARGEKRTEWEHHLQTSFPDNFDLSCC